MPRNKNGRNRNTVHLVPWSPGDARQAQTNLFFTWAALLPHPSLLRGEHRLPRRELSSLHNKANKFAFFRGRFFFSSFIAMSLILFLSSSQVRSENSAGSTCDVAGAALDKQSAFELNCIWIPACRGTANAICVLCKICCIALLMLNCWCVLLCKPNLSIPARRGTI